MEFLSGLLLMIAGWFGFDATQIEEGMADPSLLINQASETIRQ